MWEGFGLSHIEALACGIPVVAAAGGGANDTVLDGVNGYLVQDTTWTRLCSEARKSCVTLPWRPGLLVPVPPS